MPRAPRAKRMAKGLDTEGGDEEIRRHTRRTGCGSVRRRDYMRTGRRCDSRCGQNRDEHRYCSDGDRLLRRGEALRICRLSSAARGADRRLALAPHRGAAGVLLFRFRRGEALGRGHERHGEHQHACDGPNHPPNDTRHGFIVTTGARVVKKRRNSRVCGPMAANADVAMS